MKIIFTFLLLTVLISTGEANLGLRAKSSTFEEIEISVTAITENDGRTLIKCALTNHSGHVLASATPRTKCLGFRFILKDKLGDTIPMDKKWAQLHAQPDGTNDSALASRSWTAPYVRPLGFIK